MGGVWLSWGPLALREGGVGSVLTRVFKVVERKQKDKRRLEDSIRNLGQVEVKADAAL